MYIILKEILSTCFTLIPSILAFLVASYAIITSFFSSNKADQLSETDEGNTLLHDLNSSFSAAIYFLIITLLLIIIIKFVAILEIPSMYEVEVNSICAFLIIFFLLFSIFRIKDAVSDIYSIGKASILLRPCTYSDEDKKEEIKKGNNNSSKALKTIKKKKK
ncbi:hypothetical protein [Dysgonomonas sp. ZJ709]|uniref:hypothetical protein n=1 Tax=Dysgonomonas sp. ZJ709 TaxID=2709797 RepID=UPI0013ECD01B|nr:hypothetical protein [Dysgonomonas sp. ZJ709]